MSMWRRVLRTLGALHNRTSKARSRPRRGPFLPVAAEVLEDRALLSTITVTTARDVVDPNDGLTSLREAITQANASAEDDTIVLQGVRYQLSLAGAGDDANLSGDLDIRSDRGYLTLVGSAGTIIDGNGLDRVLHVLRGGRSTIELRGVTISGGVAQEDGGGIRSDHFGGLRITDSVIRNNHAGGNGGGLAIVRSHFVRITDSTIENNSAGGDGGGIWFRVSLDQVRDRVLTPNEGEGGAWIEPAFLIGGSTITRNHAWGDGGGLHLYLYVGHSSIGASYAGGATTISENSAGRRGGGLFIDGSNFGDVRIVENHAGEAGGGIFLNSESLIRLRDLERWYEDLVVADNSPQDFASLSDEVSGVLLDPVHENQPSEAQTAPAGTQDSPTLEPLVAEAVSPALLSVAFELGTPQDTSDLQATTVGTLLSAEPGADAAADVSVGSGPRSETGAEISRRVSSSDPATDEFDRLFEEGSVLDLLLNASLAPTVD